MDRHPKDVPTARKLVWNKSSLHFREKLEKPWGIPTHPHLLGHRRVNISKTVQLIFTKLMSIVRQLFGVSFEIKKKLRKIISCSRGSQLRGGGSLASKYDQSGTFPQDFLLILSYFKSDDGETW